MSEIARGLIDEGELNGGFRSHLVAVAIEGLSYQGEPFKPWKSKVYTEIQEVNKMSSKEGTEEFKEVLRDALQKAVTQGVGIEGGWDIHLEDEGTSQFTVEIYRVKK